MNKIKKRFLISFILIVTCAITSVVTIILYDNFAPISQENVFRALVGKENIEDVDTVEYKRKVTYFYKDGTEIDGNSEIVNFNWEKWG